MRSVLRFGLAFVMGVTVLLGRAEAGSYAFTNCFDNNSGICASLAPQLTVDVTDAGGGFVDFQFTNTVGIASSISDLYFDADGFLTGISLASQSSGVSFTAGSGSPGAPPGGAGSFSVTAGLLADSNSGPGGSSGNGVDATGEQLTLRFSIAAGKSFQDIIDAIDEGPDAQNGVRIAAHVQAIGTNGQSDTFICCGGTGTPSPEPASTALLGLAAAATAYRVRRWRKTATN